MGLPPRAASKEMLQRVPIPPGVMTLLLNRFFDRVSDQPHQPAIIDRQRRISYRELEDRSSRVASYLHNRGIGHDCRVAILLPKSIEAVVAILGVLKTGAAYVPLDSGTPAQRIASQLKNCEPQALFVNSSSPVLSHGLPCDPLRTVVVGEPLEAEGVEARTWEEVLKVSPGPMPGVAEGPEAAYLLYTSGSTGEPKGVVISHSAARAFVNWSADVFGLGPSDLVSSHAPFHFDLSIFDLFASLSAGASVVLVPKEMSVFPASLAAFIQTHKISVWYSVPTILSRLAGEEESRPGLLRSLRLVLFAGEVFSSKDFLRLSRSLRDTSFFNLYGPTETNVCTYHPVTGARPDEPIPIGKACPYARVFVLKTNGHLARPGEQGELWVAGDSLMSGYWNRPTETRSVKLSQPPPAIPSTAPVYRTGDLVRLSSDGNLVFLNRVDSMVKRRGYRIELGEIESCLNGNPDIQEAAVLAVQEDETNCAIEAFVAFAQEESGDTRAVENIIRRTLPDYMLPDRIHLLGSLPRTSRGKVDRNKLHKMALKP